VRGENHPPTMFGKVALNFAAVAQVIGTVFVFFGEQIMGLVGMQNSPLAQNLMENKVQLLGLTFLFNSLAQSAAKTDAFEVFVNGELIFSKLEKHRMPTLDEIYSALAQRGVAVPQSDGVIRQNVHSRQM